MTKKDSILKIPQSHGKTSFDCGTRKRGPFGSEITKKKLKKYKV